MVEGNNGALWLSASPWSPLVHAFALTTVSLLVTSESTACEKKHSLLPLVEASVLVQLMYVKIES